MRKNKIYDADTDRLKKIIENGETVWNREEEQKKIAKKTIEAIEATKGSNASKTAKEKLEEIW